MRPAQMLETRRWWQFSLRTMFAATVIIAVFTALNARGRTVVVGWAMTMDEGCIPMMGQEFGWPVTARCIDEYDSAGEFRPVAVTVDLLLSIATVAAVAVASEYLSRRRLKRKRAFEPSSGVNQPA